MAANTIQLSVVVKDDGTVALQKSVREASTAVDGLGKSAKGTSGGLGSLAVASVGVNQALELARKIADAAGLAYNALVGHAQAVGEEYLRLSQQTGIAVETLSGWSLAAKTADVDSGTLARGLKELSINMVEASSNAKGQAAQAFKQLGIEVTNADGSMRDANDVFLDAIDAINGLGSEAEKTAAKQAIFGRAALDLAPIIADGSAKMREQAELAQKLALVWSTEAAQAADEFGDQQTVLRAALGGVVDEVGVRLIPAMTEWVRGATDVIVKHRELISLGIDATFRGISTAADLVAAALGSMSRGLRSVGDTLAAILPSVDTLQAVFNVLAKTPQLGPLVSMTAGVAGFAKANADAASTATALAANLDGLGKAIQATENPSQALLDQAAGMASELKSLTEKYPAAARAVEQYRDRVKEAGKATDDAGDSNNRFTVGAKDAADAASKAADQLAQLAKGAASSAVSLVAQVAAQGDAAATSKVYGDAVAAVVDSYNAQVAAIDESAATTKVKEKQKAAAAKDAGTQIQQAAQGVVDAYKKQQQAIAQLDAAISQSKLSLLDDDIRAITEDWNELSTTQRESELPEVLAAVDEKYRLLIESATDAAEAQKAQGVTAAEAERIDANLALTTEHLNNQLEDEKQAWEDAASGAKTYITFAAAVQQELEKLSGDLSNLAASLLTGQTDWDDAGKAVAGMFLRGFEDILASQLEPLISDLLKGLMQSSGLSSVISGVGGIFGKLFGGGVVDELGPAIAGVGTNAAISQAALTSGQQIGTGVTTGFGAAITAAAPYAAAALAAGGVIYGTITTSQMGPEAKAAIITALAGPIAGGLLYAFGVLDNPDMRKRIAQEVQKVIQRGLQDADWRAVLLEGLAPLGYGLNAALVTTLSNASRSNDLLRAQAEYLGSVYGEEFMAGFSPAFTESVNKHGASSTQVPASDWIRAFFPEMDEASQAYADELAKSLASVQVAEMGLTGADAITYTENIAAGFINYAQSVGMTEEDLISFLETSNQAAGMSTRFFQTLDELNGAMVAQGVSIEGVVDKIGMFTEMDLSGAGNLVDLFIASGESAETFVKQLEKIAQTDPGLARLLASLDPPLIDALHDAEAATQDLARAFGTLSGASNASLAAVVEDFQRFAGQIRDSEGELTSMGKVLVEQTRSAVAGMQSAILEDSQVTLDEAAKVFEQLALIPAEALSDPSVKAAYDEIIANLLAGTDTASIDELKAKIAAMPPVEPPVNPETADQAKAATDDLAASVGVLGEQAAQLSEGPSVTESLGLTPEAAAAMTGVTDNLTTAVGATDGLTSSMGDLAASVTSSTDGFATLAQQSGLTSEQVQAALQPIIGTPDDGQSLSAMNDVIGRVIPESLNATTDNVLGSTGTWHDSFDYARGGVIMLHDELTGLAGNYDVTVTTTYVTVGSPPPGSTPTPTPTPEGATGGWIPGAVGEPFPMVAHGGEFLIPAEIARRVVGGGTAPYVAPSAGVGPSVDSVAAAVERRLTQGGRLHVLQVSEAQYQRLSRSILLTDLPAQVAGGSLSIPGFRRNPGAPG